MVIRPVLVFALVAGAVLAGSVRPAAARPTGACGTAQAAGASWSIMAINTSCNFAKSALPTLAAEKPYARKDRGALIKPPKGWKTCQVSFGKSGSKTVLIECSKAGTALIYQRK